jgi:hypothetical protein
MKCTIDCQCCYKLSSINIEDEWDTDDRFCPNCGTQVEIDAIPRYNNEALTLDYDQEDYEE